MPATDYLKSLKGSFNPVKKSGEKKSGLGRRPVLNQNPSTSDKRLSFGKR